MDSHLVNGVKMDYRSWMAARTEGRFTQQALVDLLHGAGVRTSQSQVSSWIRGVTIPRPYKASALHRLLAEDEVDLALVRRLYAEADRARAEAA